MMDYPRRGRIKKERSQTASYGYQTGLTIAPQYQIRLEPTVGNPLNVGHSRRAKSACFKQGLRFAGRDD